MAFHQVLSNAGALNLSSTVEGSDKKYTAFTIYAEGSGALRMSVTDGLRMWSKTYDEVSLQKYRENSLSGSLEGFLGDLKTAFQSQLLKLSVLPQQINLIVSAGVEFELPEATVHTSKQLLQELVLMLAGQVDTLQTELVATKRRVSDLEQKQRDSAHDHASTSVAAMYEPELKKTNPGPKLKRQQGRSLLNPSSRKRKAASGVVFDED